MVREDQLANVRKMVRQNSLENARVITIVSGKGGVGKSNLSLNLSIALRESDRQVALFDADTHFSNIHLLSGAPEKGALANVITGEKRLTQLQVTEESGVNIISAPSDSETFDMSEEYIKEEFFHQIYRYKSSYDFVVIDTSASLSQTIIDFSLLADDLIVIITPEPAAVSDGYAMIKVLNNIRDGMLFNVVINFVESKEEAEEVYERFSLVVEHFLGAEINFLGFIREDRSVKDAITMQKPLLRVYPESKAAQCIKKIAGGIR